MTAPTPDPTAGEGLSEAERTDLAIAVHDTDAAGCSCESVYAAVERIVAESAAATRARAEAWDECLAAVESLNPVAESVAALARHARPNPYRADSLAPDTAGESA